MIKSFETPIEFDAHKILDGWDVLYSDLSEIAQGGPQVGTVSINGTYILGYRFGGPFLVSSNYLYAPVLVKKFIGIGFKLAKIDLNNLHVQLVGETKKLIFFDRMVDNHLHYFDDLDKTKSKVYELNEL